MPPLPTTATGTRHPRTRLPPGSLCRRALGALHVGLLFVVDGQLTWWNVAARRLLGPVTDEGPWGSAIQLAERLDRMPAGQIGLRRLGGVRAPGGRLRVCGERLAGGRAAVGQVVLLAVERVDAAERASRPAPPLSESELRRRFQLTAQELHVARLLADGLSNTRVAATLGISPNTARIHTERVLRKLGVHSRAAVASTLTRGRTDAG